jgi:hypothetical protein
MRNFNNVKLTDLADYVKQEKQLINENDVNIAVPVYVEFTALGDTYGQTGVTISNLQYSVNGEIVTCDPIESLPFGESRQLEGLFYPNDEIIMFPKSGGNLNVNFYALKYTYHPSGVSLFGKINSGNTQFLKVSQYPSANKIKLYEEVPRSIEYATVTARIYIDINYKTTYQYASIKALTLSIEYQYGIGNIIEKEICSSEYLRDNESCTEIMVSNYVPRNSKLRLRVSGAQVYHWKNDHDMVYSDASVTQIVIGDNSTSTGQMYCDFETGSSGNIIATIKLKGGSTTTTLPDDGGIGDGTIDRPIFDYDKIVINKIPYNPLP